MADEKKEKWQNFLAASTVCLAVLAALSTFKGSGFSNKAVLSQNQASNQWAYFQSKSIKGYLYELQKDKLVLDVEMADRKLTPEKQAAFDAKLADYDLKIRKYNKEREEIRVEAERLERFRDDCTYHSKSFGMAIIFLQVAILLCSISVLFKNYKIWIFGLCVGAAGIFNFLNGFLMFLK